MEIHAFEKENAETRPSGRGRPQGRKGRIQMRSKSVVALKAKSKPTYELNNTKHFISQIGNIKM